MEYKKDGIFFLFLLMNMQKYAESEKIRKF